MDPYTQAVSQIIKEQRSIIGPLALDQAKKVEGLQVSINEEVQILGNRKEVLSKLVNQYAKLFGKASIEVCREAIEPFTDKLLQTDIPDILR